MTRKALLVGIFIVLFGAMALQGAYASHGGPHAADCPEYCELLNTSDPADDKAQPEGFTCVCNPLQAQTFTEIVNRVVTFLFNVALVLSPLMVVIAGIMFVGAAGDPARVSRAKQILIWTAVGFGVILLARGLVEVLRAMIGF